MNQSFEISDGAAFRRLAKSMKNQSIQRSIYSATLSDLTYKYHTSTVKVSRRRCQVSGVSRNELCQFLFEVFVRLCSFVFIDTRAHLDFCAHALIKQGSFGPQKEIVPAYF